MSTKHLRYSLSLSRLPSDCCSLAKSILANEHSNNERSFLNSLIAYGFVNRKSRNSNFFSTSFIGNSSVEKNHQFSMPISDENKLFVDHILSFKQGKLRTTEYNYLLYCGFNAFIEVCKRLYFSEKYQLINLQNEIKNEIYLSGLYPFFLTYNASVEVKESEEKYFFDIYKTSINEMFNPGFRDFSDFVCQNNKFGDQSDASFSTQKIPVPVIQEESINRVDKPKSISDVKVDVKKTNNNFNQAKPVSIDVLNSTETTPKLINAKEEENIQVGKSSKAQSTNDLWKNFI